MGAEGDQGVLDQTQTLPIRLAKNTGVMPGPGLEQLHRMLVRLLQQQPLQGLGVVFGAVVAGDHHPSQGQGVANRGAVVDL